MKERTKDSLWMAWTLTAGVGLLAVPCALLVAMAWLFFGLAAVVVGAVLFVLLVLWIFVAAWIDTR